MKIDYSKRTTSIVKYYKHGEEIPYRVENLVRQADIFSCFIWDKTQIEIHTPVEVLANRDEYKSFKVNTIEGSAMAEYFDTTSEIDELIEKLTK